MATRDSVGLLALAFGRGEDLVEGPSEWTERMEAFAINSSYASFDLCVEWRVPKLHREEVKNQASTPTVRIVQILVAFGAVYAFQWLVRLFE